MSVAELTRRLKRAAEDVSAGEWVQGEIGSITRAASGHVYFTLKDEEEDAVIDCVMYKFQAVRAKAFLEEGARLLVWGKATVWAPRGRLQFVAEKARPFGRGALLLALEELKERLAREGLFAEARKRPLPGDPKIVGIVTSAAGAVFHDIRTVAFRRGGVKLVLSAATVQGESAAASIVEAIDRIEQYPGLDVLIVGRGGGSLEDLLAFSDERVVRRVARVSVPVVSAVGHETDYSLTDLVADVRAATPSQAAELVIPDARARLERVLRLRLQVMRAGRSYVARVQGRVEALRLRMSDPRFMLVQRQQELDELMRTLAAEIKGKLARNREQAELLQRRLLARHPRTRVHRLQSRLLPLNERLGSSLRLALGARRRELGTLAGRLQALSPLAVLGRGYAICATPAGRVLTRVSGLRTGERVHIRMVDGAFESQVIQLAISAFEPEESA